MILSFRLIQVLIISLIIPVIGNTLESEQTQKKLLVKQIVTYKEGEILVKMKPGISFSKMSAIHAHGKGKIVANFSVLPGLQLIKMTGKNTVEDAVRYYRNNPDVEYAEPNFYYHTSDVPSDIDFIKQWSLRNLGDSEGIVGADISVLKGWEHSKGNGDYAIGVIDTGVLYTHPDLVDNIWTNPGEIPGNKIDDDGNGYVDDIHGINAITKSGDPLDDHGHGTHVAGTIGATGDNGIGISGVNQKTAIIGCKFLDVRGSGSAADALTCLSYFAELAQRANNPVKILLTNNSWGGGGFSQALMDAIKIHEDKGILFVAAAANDSKDNNIAETYPANYPLSNIISVAATDKKDELAYFSNYGSQTVHVGAPGAKILSTFIGDQYKEMSGTSMAAPHVSGLIGLMKSARPDLDWLALRNLVITGGQNMPSLQNKTISGRRISVAGNLGTGSLTCEDQRVTKRLLPKAKSVTLPLGESVDFAVMNINCASPAGIPQVLSLTTLGLNDNGESGDHLAGDGVFSSKFAPEKAGSFSFNFGNDDTVKVNVFDRSSWYEYVPSVESEFRYRIISGTKLELGDDTVRSISSDIPLRFGGDAGGFSELRVSSNGILSVTDSDLSVYQNVEIPYQNVETMIAPYWDDLNPGADGGVYYEAIGGAPHRELVVEWRNVRLYGGGKSGTFQVVFFEDSGDILFNYLNVDFGESVGLGKSATIGIQASSTNWAQFSFNEDKLLNNMGLRFSKKSQ